MKKQLTKFALTATLGLAITFTFAQKAAAEKPPEKAAVGTFMDIRDNKTYKTVKIGEQVWMAENLNYEAEGSRCYDNKPANCLKYGRLYDWETAMKACPKGWHLPSDDEWVTLTDFVGGSSTAGTKLKATSGWNENGNGTDAYGFAALPGGYGYSGYSSGIGNGGHWWSGIENIANIADKAYRRSIGPHRETAYRYNDDKDNLQSVRCLQGDAKEVVAVADRAKATVATPPAKAEPVPKTKTKPVPKTKAKCPYKKIGSPITVEAVFLLSECGEGCYTYFRLANGEKIMLIGQTDDDLEEGTKVSITYQREQRWIEFEEGYPFCDDQFDYLESLTVLKK